MKYLDRWVAGFLVAFIGCVVFAGSVHASVVARSPKHIYTINYSTVISSVTPFTTLQATSTLEDQPGAVYELILGTGTAGDYLVLYDTVPFNASGLATICTPLVTTNCGYQLGPRYYFGSSTQTTTVVFDPPLVFYHGLMAIQSAGGDQSGIVYEVGRGISGQ